MKLIERARALARETGKALAPSATAWHGATIAVYVFTTTVVTGFFAAYFIQDFTPQKLPAFVVGVGSIMILGVLALLVFDLVRRLPSAYRIAVFIFAPFAIVSLAMGDGKSMLIFSGVLLLIISFIGAGIAVLSEQGFKPAAQKVTLVALATGLLGLCAGSYAIFSDKAVANPLLAGYVLEDRTLNLPNPGLPGNYDVRTLAYGSGKKQPRRLFGEDAALISRTVDGSKLIDNWDGVSGWLRSSYWGFDVTELPLQAQVWYPAGDGPFPLVLVVHGNHSMEDFSDPGYGYLGELFASRGIILASVDENFINSSISASVNVLADRPGLEEENDARGWLLLQHLALWRDWNGEAGHPFQGKVDMDRVALIGHSRGGEAVGVAAAFNALDRYPDDATLDFDFDFNLRGVIAIAPVYGQYQPRDRYTPVRDVNYFTIHGDMDGDVQSFEGMAQYSRVSFPGDEFRFRSGLYVIGANHGQFNTTWQNMDMSWYRSWALDLPGIMDGEAQRDVARVYFSAFLEVVLRDRDEYLPIFADARKAAAWLPNTFYINQFASSVDEPVADFEEDIDPSTMSIPGGRITAAQISKWYEVANELKQDELDTHSVVFAWDKRFSETSARIDFTLPTDRNIVGANKLLVASISALATATMPDAWEGEHTEGAPDDDGEKDEPLDWSIVLTDANGSKASLPLSYDSVLYPLVNAVPRRASFLDAEDPTEVLFRRFEFPFVAFAVANPQFDIDSVAQISFVFDRSAQGAIIMDDISISSNH